MEIHEITECFAGATSPELAQKFQRCMDFLGEHKERADDPEDWFTDAYQELLDQEPGVGEDIADVRDSVFERLEADRDDEESQELFDEALEQWCAERL